MYEERRVEWWVVACLLFCPGTRHACLLLCLASLYVCQELSRSPQQTFSLLSFFPEAWLVYSSFSHPSLRLPRIDRKIDTPLER